MYNKRLKKPVSPEKAVRRLKFISLIIILMLGYVFYIKMSNRDYSDGTQQTEQDIDIVTRAMDSQLDSLIAALLPEGTVVEDILKVNWYTVKNFTELRIQNLQMEYEMIAASNKNKERLLEKKALIEEEKKKLKDKNESVRLYSRLVRVVEPDGRKGNFYQALTTDLKNSYMIKYLHPDIIRSIQKETKKTREEIETKMEPIKEKMEAVLENNKTFKK